MTGYETLTLERTREGLAVLTLERPERLNALTFPMFDELAAVAAELTADEELRAVVLTGAGRGFCSGMDLDEAARLPRLTTVEFSEAQERFSRAVAALRAIPQPLIAAVNGAAAGGGLSMALLADYRIGSESARFNAAFVRIGLSAGDLGVSWLLPRIVGAGIAAEMMFTGRFVEAAEAERIGLVNRIVAPERLLDEALADSETIAANSPFGVRMSKRVLHANLEAPSFAAALEVENRGQVLATRTEDMPEALEAFRAKRDPVFRNR